MPTASGRELVYALYVMNVPLNQVEDLFPVMANLGAMAEQIYSSL